LRYFSLHVRFAFSSPASQWANVGGYFPGMSKRQAKAHGQSDCESKVSGTVICRPARSISFAGIFPVSFDIALSETSGSVQTITVSFPRNAFPDIAAELQKIYGIPTAMSEDYRTAEWQRRAGIGHCSDAMIWHRGGDEVIGVCGQLDRRKGATFVLVDRIAGRGTEWAEMARARVKGKATISSPFESK
jgi:hypothetical protein